MIRQLIETPVGNLTAIWTARGLYACEFRGSSIDEAAQPEAIEDDRLKLGSLETSMAELESLIAKYFRSGKLKYDLDRLDWNGVPSFHRRVLELSYKVPSGGTVSYGQLAEKAGSVGAARAVGSAMARNRWPILIPCHRVVGANGKLTGYSGLGGVATKRWLLDFECEYCGSLPLLFSSEAAKPEGENPELNGSATGLESQLDATMKPARR